MVKTPPEQNRTIVVAAINSKIINKACSVRFFQSIKFEVARIVIGKIRVREISLAYTAMALILAEIPFRNKPWEKANSAAQNVRPQ
jgi:hypothetical protein